MTNSSRAFPIPAMSQLRLSVSTDNYVSKCEFRPHAGTTPLLNMDGQGQLTYRGILLQSPSFVSGGSARRIQRELLDDPASLRPNPSMGFNKRKMEDQRQDGGEKEAAARGRPKPSVWRPFRPVPHSGGMSDRNLSINALTKIYHPTSRPEPRRPQPAWQVSE